MVLPARLNPFRVQRLDCLSFRFLQQSKAEVLRRLEQQSFRGEISGPEGSGKTLLLNEMLGALRERGIRTALIILKHRETANNYRALWRGVLNRDRRTVLGLDGAEQLGPLAWLLVRFLARRLQGLIITTHHPGRLPFLYKCSTTPALLQELTAELLEENEVMSFQDATKLHALYGGNIRAALLHCYDSPHIFRRSRTGT